MVDVTHDFTGLIPGGSLEDEATTTLTPIGSYSEDGFIGSTPAGALETERGNALYLDLANQPTSADYVVSSPTKNTYNYRHSSGPVVRGNSTTGECYVAHWRASEGWRVDHSSGGQYPTYTLIGVESNPSAHPGDFENVELGVVGTGSSIAFVLKVDDSIVLNAVIGSAPQIDSIGYGGLLVRGSASIDVQNTSVRINDAAVADGDGPTADVSPTLNSDEWSPGVNVEFSDLVSATVTNYVVAILGSDTTPSPLQISEGKNSAGTVLDADQRASAASNSGVADVLRCPGASVDGGKLCIVSADESANLSSAYIVNFPAREAVTSTEKNYVASTTLTVVDQADPNASVILLAQGPLLDNGIQHDILEIADPASEWNYTKVRVVSYDADGHADGPNRAVVKKLIPGFTLANGQTVKAHLSLSEVKVGEVDGVYVGTVSGTPTTTTAVISSGVAFDGQYVGSVIKFLEGPAAGTPVAITGSVASTNTLTFAALPAAPVVSDAYKIA